MASCVGLLVLLLIFLVVHTIREDPITESEQQEMERILGIYRSYGLVMDNCLLEKPYKGKYIQRCTCQNYRLDYTLFPHNGMLAIDLLDILGGPLSLSCEKAGEIRTWKRESSSDEPGLEFIPIIDKISNTYKTFFGSLPEDARVDVAGNDVHGEFVHWRKWRGDNEVPSSSIGIRTACNVPTSFYRYWPEESPNP